MSVLPNKLVEEIQFGESHYPVWLTAYASIGISTETATSVKDAVVACRKAFDDAQAARDASKAATHNLTVAQNTMHSLLADTVKQIRLYAQTTNNPDVFTKAQIPPPAAPTPAPPPMQPTNLGVQLRPDGVLRITFRATDPSNTGSTTYLVSRKLAGETDFRVVGTAGTSRSTFGANLPRGYKFFDDDKLPAGSNNMMYMVQGQRGKTYGEPSQIFTVTIGAAGGSGDVQTATLKMAA
jgi:hypothetical protein